MTVKIKVTVTGVDRVQRRLRAMGRRAEDFRPVLRWARRELSEANRVNFSSNGAASGNLWMPLDDEYARWKLRNKGPRPLLVDTGALYSELTTLRGSPNEIGRTKAVFGTNLPYAKFHQYGTRHMAARKIVYDPPLFSRRLGEKAVNHIVYGNIHGIDTSRAKGLFYS